MLSKCLWDQVSNLSCLEHLEKMPVMSDISKSNLEFIRWGEGSQEEVLCVEKYSIESGELEKM